MMMVVRRCGWPAARSRYGAVRWEVPRRQERRGQLAGFSSSGRGSHEVDVTAANFQEAVLRSSVPVVLDCYASWCQPCKQLTPLLSASVAATKGRVVLGLLDTENEPQLTDSLQIKNLPTVFGVVDGKVLDHFVGGQPKEAVEQFVARLAAKSRAPMPEPDGDAVLKQAAAFLADDDPDKALSVLETEYQRLQDEAAPKNRRGLSRLFDEKTPEAFVAARVLEAIGRCRVKIGDAVNAKTALAALKDAKRSAVLDKDLALKASVASLDLAVRDLDAQQGDTLDPFSSDLAALRTAFAAGETADALDRAIDLVVQANDQDQRDAARTLVLTFIDALQPSDPPAATRARKRLANVLFR